MDFATTIILEAKTQKGKNRIQEHGKTWSICMRAERVNFSTHLIGGWILVQSLKNPNHIRWINERDDENFRIIK